MRKLLIGILSAFAIGAVISLIFWRPNVGDSVSALSLDASSAMRSSATSVGADQSRPSNTKAPQPASANAHLSSHNAADLYSYIRSLARTAYEGDSRAQLEIAKALLICLHTYPNLVEFVSIQEAKRIDRDIGRCSRLRNENPFVDLPAPEPGDQYNTFEYWLERATLAGLPLAQAITALTGQQLKPGETSEEAVDRTQQLLKDAVRSNDPEVFMYAGLAVETMDANDGPTVKGAAWYLLACRKGACDTVLVPFFSVPCPEGLGKHCEYRAAIEYGLERELGALDYAKAVTLSYQLEDAIEQRDWSRIDFSVK